MNMGTHLCRNLDSKFSQITQYHAGTTIYSAIYRYIQNLVDPTGCAESSVIN